MKDLDEVKKAEEYSRREQSRNALPQNKDIESEFFRTVM